MSVYELAKKYYPRLWDKPRLEALVQAGRLTLKELAELTVGEIQTGPGEAGKGDG